MNLSRLLTDICVETDHLLDIEIKNIEIDSRRVVSGTLFICISGYVSDGHDFALAAQEKGAVAVVCSRNLDGLKIPCIIVEDCREAWAKIAANFYDRPCNKIKMIGVTGTNGKTTVTHLVKEILDFAGYRTGLIGTAHNVIGDRAVNASMTTPDPTELHKLLREMVDDGCEYVAMEVSSHSLELKKLTGCEFEVAAFTNLTQDHLDFHNTMEDYFAAKGKLMDVCKHAVINVDDDFGKRLMKEGFLSIGMEDDCDLKAEDIILSSRSVQFDCLYRGSAVKARLSIPGLFNVYNGLTAVGICLLAGVDINTAIKGLASARGVKGRVEVIPCEKDYTIIIDYAHTPDALETVLNTIRGFATGRIITVFGCGGDRDRGKRPMMGNVAGKLSDFCVVTSDNPRTEKPETIIRDVIGGMDENAKFIAIENRMMAIKYAMETARTNDIILLAGKGHETYQIFKDNTIDFDERQVVKELISQGV